MNKYTKYNDETGAIEYVFSGSEEDAHLNTPNIEGDYPAKEYTVVDGKPVRKADTDIAQSETARAWIILRNRRNGYLSDSDWTQALDSPLTDAKKTEWATYRQNLRDYPGTVSDPSNASFPDKPD